MEDDLITFSDRLLTDPHCTTFTDGQLQYAQCPLTTVTYQWSATEAGAYDAAVKKHEDDHRDAAWEWLRLRGQAPVVAEDAVPVIVDGTVPVGLPDTDW